MDANALLLIFAGGGFLTGVAAIITAVINGHNSARKDEMESLRATIKSLQEENTRMQKRMELVEKENIELCNQIDDLQRENKDLKRRLEELSK